MRASVFTQCDLCACVRSRAVQSRYLPSLSRRFAHVLGIDLSQRLLDRAMQTVVWTGAGRSRQRRLKNVELAQADLTAPFTVPVPADFGCCINVLLEANDAAHVAILGNVRSALKPGAGLLVLVPSLESYLHVVQLQPDETQQSVATCRGSDVLLGRLPREGVLTQHFLREHITRLLTREGFDVVSCDRLEYHFRHEVDEGLAARLVGETPPWDWLVFCHRRA
jgi:SAM-dependent methyltransferase